MNPKGHTKMLYYSTTVIAWLASFLL